MPGIRQATSDEMQEIIKYAQLVNVQQFWLPGNKAGRPLYEKMGFVAVNVLVMLPMRKCISERIGSYVFTSLTPRFAVHAPVCALCTKITAPGTRISCIFAYSWVSKI